MNSLTTAILKEARAKGEGTVLFPKEFLHLGTRANVDQTFTRLVKKGELTRIGRGVYTRPVTGRFGKRSPATERVVYSLSKKTNTPIVSNSSASANALGITTQVPTQEVFLTSGFKRWKLELGARKVEVRPAPAWQLAYGNTSAGQAIRAMAWAGPEHAVETAVHLKRTLPSSAWRKLFRIRSQLPGWASAALGRVE